MNVINFIMRNYKKQIRPKYMTEYKYISEQTNIPIEFITAHATIESNQTLLARGNLGEYGLWQFLPSTWNQLMNNKDWKNINNQVNAYIKHAKTIINRYNLNMHSELDQTIFLWCWNAGMGNYEKNVLPESTRKYISKVIETTRQVFI